MNLSKIRVEIKQIKDKEIELLKEKQNIERNVSSNDLSKQPRLKELNNALKNVKERLEKALRKENELGLKEVTERSLEREM